MSKCKLVHYIGDYGPGNFWENIKKSDVQPDLELIKNSGFNTIVLMLPFATFRPNQSDNLCDHTEIYNYILDTCEKMDIAVMIRIGYLWDTTFSEDRTMERYMDMYSHYTKGTTSKYEQGFIDYVQHYHDDVRVSSMILSWEDFFWPVAFHEETSNDIDSLRVKSKKMSLDVCTPLDDNWPYYGDEPIDNINRVFVEHLINLFKGSLTKLVVEQRSNGIFNRINTGESHNTTYMGYYNPYSLRGQWYKMIKRDFTLIHDNMVMEKQFMEWYSRMCDILRLERNNNKLIINQFNIVDNTYDDDEHHNKNVGYNIFKQKGYMKNMTTLFKFFEATLPQWLEGIGVWALWTTINGTIYNGTFKYGTKGWDTTGELIDDTGVKLTQGDCLSTNVAYARVDRKQATVLLKFKTKTPVKINIKLGDQSKTVNILHGQTSIEVMFNNISDTDLGISVTTPGEITITRVDYYRMKLKSFMYDAARKPTELQPLMESLLNAFR